MQRPAKTSSAKRPANLARLVITLFALFAFTLQSFVMQVHVHGATHIAAADTVKSAGKSAPDQANCPICQEILHAGQYVTPSVAGWMPLSLTSSVISIATGASVLSQSTSHSWNSRAPPRL